MPKPKLLLHVCCAPCSGYLAKELSRDYQVTVYFDNPNIFPDDEYFKRREETEKFFKKGKIDYVEGVYNHEVWREYIKGLELEPEKGKRCKLCYHYRLEKAAEYASENHYDLFASTLAISPHKNSEIVNSLGTALAKTYKVEFLAEDWKKEDGFKKAMELANKEAFYRQNYCGCEFSK